MIQRIFYDGTDITDLLKAGKWSHPVSGIQYPPNKEPLEIEGVYLVDAPDPEPEEFSVVLRDTFTSLEFFESFTDAEQLAIVQVTMTNAQVKLWYDKMIAALKIDLKDPRTALGLTALVTAGLLTQARKDELLTPRQ